jgi:3-hydroxyisobutyryl-CoA hydrolase
MFEEHRVNHIITAYPKPIVAICDCITMDGGVGIFVRALFRIATEKTVFAMPETAIGLFPDVGSTLLPWLDGGLGAYLSLTGDQLCWPGLCVKPNMHALCPQ